MDNVIDARNDFPLTLKEANKGVEQILFLFEDCPIHYKIFSLILGKMIDLPYQFHIESSIEKSLEYISQKQDRIKIAIIDHIDTKEKFHRKGTDLSSKLLQYNPNVSMFSISGTPSEISQRDINTFYKGRIMSDGCKYDAPKFHEYLKACIWEQEQFLHKKYRIHNDFMQNHF